MEASLCVVLGGGTVHHDKLRSLHQDHGLLRCFERHVRRSQMMLCPLCSLTHLSLARSLQTPKIMITTRPRPSGNLFHFVQDLLRMMPNAFFYPRSESRRARSRAIPRNLLVSDLGCSTFHVCVCLLRPVSRLIALATVDQYVRCRKPILCPHSEPTVFIVFVVVPDCFTRGRS